MSVLTKKDELNLRVKKINQIMEEFRIWARHTGNEDWISFATIKLNQKLRVKAYFTDCFIHQEVNKIQKLIRKIKSL